MTLNAIQARWTLVVLAMLLLVGAVVWTFLEKRSGERSTIPAVKFDERVKAALDLRQETSRGIFQVTVVLVGALWGLVIAKESFKEWGIQEAILFALANLALLGSLLAHTQYAVGISNTLIDAVLSLPDKNTIPEITVGRLDFCFIVQKFLFLAGSIVTGLTFLSAKLK